MVTLPPGSSCGTRLHLPGHGLPSRNGSSGDLIAKVKIVMPTSLTTIERKLFQRLAERSSFDPRNVA
jgi:curved DNA-binding protein